MDALSLRLAVLLLHLRHTCVQLHQTLYRGVSAAIDPEDKLQVGLARHPR